MSNPSRSFSAPAPLVALAGWVVPGAGYWLVGQKTRGTVVGVTILVLFLVGILVGGIRVIDVPGYDDRGQKPYVRDERAARPDANNRFAVRELKSVDPGNTVPNSDWVPMTDWRWILRAHPFPEIANKPWFVGQVLTGPACLLAAHVSLGVSQPIRPGASISMVPRSHARISEIGTLYTAIAGMLNLLAIIDSAYRAGQGGAMSAILAFQLFVDPLPIWDYWPWLLIPLAVGVSVVYKSIKCKSMSTVPQEAAGITLWIIGGMVFAAAVLWAMVELVNRV